MAVDGARPFAFNTGGADPRLQRIWAMRIAAAVTLIIFAIIAGGVAGPSVARSELAPLASTL